MASFMLILWLAFFKISLSGEKHGSGIVEFSSANANYLAAMITLLLQYFEPEKHTDLDLTLLIHIGPR